MRAPEIIPWSTRGERPLLLLLLLFFFFQEGASRQFPTKTSGIAKTAKKIVDGSHGKNRANDFYYRGPTFVVKKLSCTSYCSPKKIMHLRSHMTFSCLICSLILKRFSERQNILEVEPRNAQRCSKGAEHNREGPRTDYFLFSSKILWSRGHLQRNISSACVTPSSHPSHASKSGSTSCLE